MDRNASPANRKALDFLQKMDPHRLSRALQGESATTIAVVLGGIDRVQAAKVLADLPAEERRTVAAAMTQARALPEPVVSEIAAGLREKLQAAPARPKQAAPGMVTYGGPTVAASILRYAPESVRRNVQEAEPDLFAQLQHIMFTFDDFQHVPDRSLQIVFAEVETQALAMALKVSTPSLRQRILHSMSARRAALVEDELERLERLRMSDVEAAQQGIIDIAQEMQRRGRVVLDQGDAVV